MLLAIFLTSLLGSLHCAGMCGGLVAFTCGSCERPWRAQALYHIGRLLAYLALGALAGLAGGSLDRAGNLLGVQHGAALVSGLSMIVWALWVLLKPLRQKRAANLSRVSLRQAPTSALSGFFARVYVLPGGVRGAVLGLSSGLLPCGWLYAFVITSAGQASWMRGALVMGAFWAGSVPILVGMGTVANLLSVRVRRHIPALGAVLLLVIGIGSVAARSSLADSKAASSLPSAASPDDCHAH